MSPIIKLSEMVAFFHLPLNIARSPLFAMSFKRVNVDLWKINDMNLAITETGLKYSYSLDNLENRDDAKLKLITKVQRGYYYSCINEINEHFDEVIYPTLKTKKSCKNKS